MQRVFRFATLLVLLGALSGSTLAITWFPEDFVCPVDKQKNTFQVIGSYGSYIYSYPSKYQWLFFPQTDSPTYYLCKKCHLATYMWDFDKLPKEKIADIRKVLTGVKVSKKFNEYREIPIVERLEIMEKVYAVLGRDDDWWESFYRVKGYHYGKAGDAAKASEARRKALALIEKDLADPKSEKSKKLQLYTAAAMKHFLGDDKGALETFQKAAATLFQEKDLKPEDVKNGEDGLNERIKDYVDKINGKNEMPRLFDKSGDRHDDH